MIVTPDREGKVIGAGAAYMLRVDHKPELLERGKPLTYRGLKVWKFTAGETIDVTADAVDRFAAERSREEYHEATAAIALMKVRIGDHVLQRRPAKKFR